MNQKVDAAQPEPKYRPSRYMRERHPDLFSDSVEQLEFDVSREVLSYHLETLTNQKDETAFEHFAQRLCERFIAPNMRPQTGPVGGGDGKTDAETYLVSRDISLRWFVPDNNKAGERKAFAFSAKKTWRPKVKLDVAAIAGTQRDYDQIYFVTNQFVPARKSAEVQDELTKLHGIPVTILDRTWLLDRIFGHNSMDIAVDELGIGRGSEKQSRKLGPKDTTRAAELVELESQIADGTKYQGQPIALAEDARRAALLSRSLESPALEVNGRFDRALRLVRETTNRKLELAIAYDWAWTSHFWHEDHERTSELYDDVERLAIGSHDADDLERLNNLLPLVRVSVQSGSLDPKKGKLDARTKALKAALAKLSTETNRANNALHAEAMLLMTRVSEKGVAHRDDPLIDIWVQFTDVIKRAEGLGTFPFTSIAEALIQVGEFIADSKEFDELFETITDALAARSGEGEAASKNVQRAYQKLEKGLNYDAIRWFGRAVALLIKEEYEDELIDALVGAGIAFEQVGLPWAARNFTLAAASQQLGAFKKSGSLSAVRPSILGRYFETELKLGRVPQILSAHEIELIVRGAQARSDGQKRRLEQVQQSHMMEIGSILLHARFDQLQNIAQLPDSLDRLALPMARTSLLYLMGHEAALREEGSIPGQETGESAEAFFKEMYDYADRADLPPPDFCLGSTVVLSSNVLGCRIELECENNLVSLGIGEAVLGSLEALLATSLDQRILPQLDHLRLRVLPSDTADLTPTLTFEDVDGEPVGTITHRNVMEYKTREDALSFPNWLKGAVLDIFLRFATPREEKWVTTVMQDERILDRALTFSNIPTMLGNLHGDRLQLALSDWIDPSDRVYDVTRGEPWAPTAPAPVHTYGDAQRGTGLPPEGMFDQSRMKHSRTKWVSPIDIQKWDKAKWNGTIFLWSPPEDDAVAPMLGLAFENSAKAKEIFIGWRKRFGEDDVKNDLQITIVRGISRKNPAAYAVMVGGNPSTIPTSKDGWVGFVSRINRMYPQSTQNLDAFLADYDKHKKFVLIPAHLPTKKSAPQPIFDLAIGKHNLVVVNAWEIAPNDLTASVLDLDELPFIPPEQQDAPVIKTIEWLRKIRARK